MPFAPGDLRVIESFASQLGLPARPARDGSFGFVFAGDRHVTFTPPAQDEGVVMSVTWHPTRVDAAMMRRCLAEAGFDPEHGMTLHSGLAGDGALIVSVRLDPNEISLPVIESCLQDLFARRDRVAG